MQNFNNFNLPKSLLASLETLNYKKPTPIQEKALPPALCQRDVLGSAQTGTGKTGAFGIALVAHLINSPESQALVVTPTRELASQVMQVLEGFIGTIFRHKTALLIGGAPIDRQLRRLKKEPRLVVGTPGRIHDHIKRKSLKLTKTDFLVLDETDRMLDMGFSIQIDNILEHMPEKRQTLLFSATLPKHIIKITDKYLSKPIRVSVATTLAAPKKMHHETVSVSSSGKYEQLVKELVARGGSILVFVKTKISADKIAYRLRKNDFNVQAIHGDLNHRKRESVIRAYRAKKTRILIATDVACRGLDIPHIEHVINFDLPQCPEDYIHRIGRTARADKKGSAVGFIAPSEKGKWRIIEELLDPTKKTAPSLSQKKFSEKKKFKKKSPPKFLRKRTNARFKKQKRQKTGK